MRKNRTSIGSPMLLVSPLIAAMSTPTPPPNITLNEKGAVSYATTESAVLDWFASGGALRNESEDHIQAIFAKAFAEDRLLATKVAFYIRDVRGGQGQRKSFRAVLNWLARNAPSVVRKNLAIVPNYGRWDDILSLLGSPVEKDVIKLVSNVLASDLEQVKINQNVSLLGKWMPSENASNKQTRDKARKLRKALELSPRAYRKMLSLLREKINIIERLMCAGKWTQINYEHVPSRAMMAYRKALPKHDPVGFNTWKGKAYAGTAKVHASTLYPYDIVAKVMRGNWDDTLELQWRNLPDMFSGKIHSGLVVCDVSGSMMSWEGGSGSSSVRPLDIAISLAMYMGERMNGPFKNHFITFSRNPELQEIRGNSLSEKAKNLNRAHWEMNTDIQKVFSMILDRATAAKLKQEDLPDAIYIVSDLQFDACGFNKKNFDVIKDKFANAGYQMPLLVFWQVRASHDKVALKSENGVAMVSGFSPSALKGILKLEEPKEATPMEVMLATVNCERYEPIRV